MWLPHPLRFSKGGTRGVHPLEILIFCFGAFEPGPCSRHRFPPFENRKGCGSRPVFFLRVLAQCPSALSVSKITNVKIAIDIRRMNEFGVGTYTRNIIRALARLDRQNKYFLLGPAAKVGEIGKLPDNFKAVPLTASETIRGEMHCSAVLRRLNCDLVHVPHLFWFPRR